nr:cell adhesion molecule:down regulated by [Hymenolepis microstoma]
MWLTNFLWILLFPLMLLLLFHPHPTLAQPVTGNIISNSTVAKKSKRFPVETRAMADSPSLVEVGDPGVPSIDWRFSLGNPANTSHVDFNPQIPKGGFKRNNKASWRPQVTVIGDNLAVNLSWPSQKDSESQLSHYRIQFRHREPHELKWARPFVVVQTRLSGRVAEPYIYVTNKQPGGLEAGKVYQFQVVAVYLDAETSEEKSRWSSTLSFDYISPEPPLFRVARRLPDGTVHIKWSRPWRNEDFKITRFIILFRKEKRLPGGETAFHGFQHITVPGNLEEYKVTGLDRDAGYQFVIYGEHTPEGVDPNTSLFTGGLNGRKITAFSQEVFVPMDATSAARVYKSGANASSGDQDGGGILGMNTNASNSLMFLILGVLAGAMLIVMVFLVAICFVRQRKEKLRLLAQTNAVRKGHTASGASHEVINGGIVSKVGSSVNESVGGGGRKIPSVIGGGGFLLAELTPIAVANFRTAPPPVSCRQQPPSSQPSNNNAGDPSGLGLRSEYDPLFLTTSPSDPHHHSLIDESNSGDTSSSIPSEFDAAAVADMKREPPSGGSIHGDESDGGNNGGGDRAQHTSMIPSPTREAVFYTAQISPLNYYPPLLRVFHHNNRRSPPPALGSELSRFDRARAFDHEHSRDQLGLLRQLAPSHSFAHYPDSSAADWLLRPRNSTGLGRFSPPPQRIQAIVPQTDGKVGEEIAEGMEFRRKFESSEEFSPTLRAKTPTFGISSKRILPPRRRVSLLNQRSIFNQSVASAEQADAYTQTTVSNKDTRSYSAVGGIPRGKRKFSSNLLSKGEPRVDFVDSQESSIQISSVKPVPVALGDLNRQV